MFKFFFFYLQMIFLCRTQTLWIINADRSTSATTAFRCSIPSLAQNAVKSTTLTSIANTCYNSRRIWYCDLAAWIWWWLSDARHIRATIRSFGTSSITRGTICSCLYKLALPIIIAGHYAWERGTTNTKIHICSSSIWTLLPFLNTNRGGFLKYKEEKKNPIYFKKHFIKICLARRFKLIEYIYIHIHFLLSLTIIFIDSHFKNSLKFLFLLFFWLQSTLYTKNYE